MRLKDGVIGNPSCPKFRGLPTGTPTGMGSACNPSSFDGFFVFGNGDAYGVP